MTASPAPQRAWWNEFSRRDVRAAIEEATGTPLSALDPLPDSLIAEAQQLGLHPVELRLWIYDDPRREAWSMDVFARWARRYALGIFREAEDGAPNAAA